MKLSLTFQHGLLKEIYITCGYRNMTVFAVASIISENNCSLLRAKYVDKQILDLT